MRFTNFDAVLTYHSNIHTCGVARFNHYLATHLSVPLVRIVDELVREFRHPIISIKVSEILDADLNYIQDQVGRLGSYSLIVHDLCDGPLLEKLVFNATRVMGLNKEISLRLRNLRPDVLIGHTVASYEQPKPSLEANLTLITFGMAHKIQSARYQKVAKLLKFDPRSHILEISSALHEGTQFDDSFFEVGDEIAGLFEGRVRFLGFLADPEVSNRVARSSAMLAFFPSGARENNNSVLSAMHLGVPVITNLDALSPVWLKHNETVFDIESLQQFPSDAELKRVGSAGRAAVADLTYAMLIKSLSAARIAPSEN